MLLAVRAVRAVTECGEGTEQIGYCERGQSDPGCDVREIQQREATDERGCQGERCDEWRGGTAGMWVAGLE